MGQGPLKERGDGNVSNKEIKETLEKQLQLLSERSNIVCDPAVLLSLTSAMCAVVEALRTIDSALA